MIRIRIELSMIMILTWTPNYWIRSLDKPMIGIRSLDHPMTVISSQTSTDNDQESWSSNDCVLSNDHPMIVFAVCNDHPMIVFSVVIIQWSCLEATHQWTSFFKSGVWIDKRFHQSVYENLQAKIITLSQAFFKNSNIIFVPFKNHNLEDFPQKNQWSRSS